MTPKQQKIIDTLKKHGPLSPKQIEDKGDVKFARKTLRTLEKKGLVSQKGIYNDVKYSVNDK